MPTNFSPGLARNHMRRAIREALDPEPSRAKKEELRRYFRHSCAYCGTSVAKKGLGQLDHADPDGGNHLGNRVLACARCNVNEKGNRGWLEFLRHKATTKNFRERKARIERWMAKNPPPLSVNGVESIQRQKRMLEELADQFHERCGGLKELVQRERTKRGFAATEYGGQGRRRTRATVDIVGIDWSGAKDAGRWAWVCRAKARRQTLEITELAPVSNLDTQGARDTDSMLRLVEEVVVGTPGSRWVGLDFPFSVTSGVVKALGYKSWKALIADWEERFQSADAFREACREAFSATPESRSENAKRLEMRRKTDEDTGAPMSPWNERVYRQTYHGGRLLSRLHRRRKARSRPRVAILPWDDPMDADVRVLEICPASTLKTLQEDSDLYKGKASSRKRTCRRAQLLSRVKSELGIEIPAALESEIEQDGGGDALDAVLAAASTYHHCARLTDEQHARIRRDRNAKLEGYIYAVRPD